MNNYETNLATISIYQRDFSGEKASNSLIYISISTNTSTETRNY